MNVRTDTTPPAKRRRLDITSKNQNEAIATEPTAHRLLPCTSLVSSHRSLPGIELCYGDGVALVHDEPVVAGIEPANSDDPGNNEQDSSECCYGMVGFPVASYRYILGY